MVFSSLNFLFIFLPVTLLAHLLAPRRMKNLVLLLCSIFFYAWGEPVYVLLMLMSIAFNYLMGLQLESTAREQRGQVYFVTAVAINLILLGFYKYYGFLIGTLNGLFGIGIRERSLPLPIGISFYTFQALSYIIDVRRGNTRAQRKIIDFALYIVMFPQLVAGPIVTYTSIEKELHRRKLTLHRFGLGMRWLIIGMAKKVILANNLGALHTLISGSAQRSTLTVWLGAIAYMLQIYFDFSGYSDMAIGMGHMLGFTFPKNFDYPYTAVSVTDFWRRWHMSLSGWFREYVYIPLGGNRVGVAKHIRNIAIVWMLTGLWHGASWNFVLWGAYYGLILIIEKYLTGSLLRGMPVAFARAITLLTVLFGWVIFSNTNFAEMGRFLGNMFGIGTTAFSDTTFLYLLRNNAILLLAGTVCCAPPLFKWYDRTVSTRPVPAIVIGVALLLISVAYLVGGSYNPFLYFRF